LVLRGLSSATAAAKAIDGDDSGAPTAAALERANAALYFAKGLSRFIRENISSG
jgi:hypothetical protein